MSGTPLLIERRHTDASVDDLVWPAITSELRIRLEPGEVYRWHGPASVSEHRHVQQGAGKPAAVQTWTFVGSTECLITDRRLVYYGSAVRWANGTVSTAAEGALLTGQIRFQWPHALVSQGGKRLGVRVGVLALSCHDGPNAVDVVVALSSATTAFADKVAEDIARALTSDIARFRLTAQAAHLTPTQTVQLLSQRDTPASSQSGKTLRWEIAGGLPIGYGAHDAPPEQGASGSAQPPTQSPPQAPAHLQPALAAFVQLIAKGRPPSAYRKVVDKHPVLLSDEMDSFLDSYTDVVRNNLDANALHMFIGLRGMLRRWREAGPDAALDHLVHTVLEIDPANRAVWAFNLLIHAKTSAEAAAALDNHPELLEPAGLAAIDRFIADSGNPEPEVADFTTRYRQLLVRCQEVGVPAAVAELDTVEDLPPDVVSARVDADKAEEAYAAAGDPTYLDRSVQLRVMILEHPDLPASHHADATRSAAKAYWIRYEASGDRDDLDNTLALCQAVLDELPAEAPDRIAVLSNLATATMARYAYTGDLSDLTSAVDGLRAVAAHFREESPDLRATASANLGAALAERYRHTMQDRDLAESITACETATELTPFSSPAWPGYTTGLAEVLRLRHQLGRDRADLDRAVELNELIVGRVPRNAPDRPLYLANLANSLVERHDVLNHQADADKAIEAYQAALYTTPPGAPGRAGMLNSYALALNHRFHATANRVDLESAVTAWRGSCAEGEANSPGAVLLAANNWSQAAMHQQSWPEVVEACGAGLGAVERLLRTQLVREHKESWLQEANHLAARGAYAMAKLGDLQTAAVTLERGRAWLLAEALERNQSQLRDLVSSGHDHLLSRYRQAALALAQAERVNTTRSGRGPTLAALPHDQLEVLRTAQVQLDGTIKAIRSIEGFEHFLAPPTFTDITAALDHRTLAYVTVTQAGGFVLIIDGSANDRPALAVQWLDQLDEEAVLALAQRYAAAYATRSRDHLNWWRTLDEVTGRLWDVLMAPLLAILPADSKVILVAGGLLGLLPLHAAWTTDPAKPTGRRYALDHLLITYAPNARSLQRSRTSDITTQAMLGVNQPYTSGNGDHRLKFSGLEVDKAQEKFASALTLHEREATKERVLSALPHHSVLHFACHGSANLDKPLESGLLLAHNQRLTLRDLFNQPRLDVRLAVLSACETAIAGTDLPDEVISLPTGLLQAGATGVIGSLWAVPDVSTAALMIRFYELCCNDRMEPAEALRSAQQWLRDATNGQLHRWMPELFPLKERLTGQEVASWHAKRSHKRADQWAAFAYIGA